MTDLVLIADAYNNVDLTIFKELGLNYESDSINFNYIIDYELKVIPNNDFYTKTGDRFVVNGDPTNLIDLYNNENAVKLNIVGIIRPVEGTKLEILTPGIGYSDDFSMYFIEDTKSSEIVKIPLFIQI